MLTRFCYKTAPAGGLLAFTASLLTCLAALPRHFWIALAIAIVSAASVYWWLSQVDITIARRRPEAWQSNIEVEDCGVSPAGFNRLRHYFHKDEKVLRITHQHIIVLILRLSWVIGLLVVFIAVVVILGTVHLSLPRHLQLTPTHQSTSTTYLKPVKPALPVVTPTVKSPVGLHWPKNLTIPWWLLLLPVVILAWLALRIWLAWVSWFFIITTERLVVLELPYPIFPFAEEDDNPFPLNIIKRAEVKGSSFRKRWGLAIMNISTYLQPEEDAVIKNLFGLPGPEDLKEVVNGLAKDNTDDLDQSLGPDLRQLTAALRENTAMQRRSLGETGDDYPTEEL